MDLIGRDGLSSASPSIAALIFGDTTPLAPRSSRAFRTNAASPIAVLTYPSLGSPKGEVGVGCDQLEVAPLLQVRLD